MGSPYAVEFQLSPRGFRWALEDVPGLLFRSAGGGTYYLLGHPDIHPVTQNFHSRHAHPLLRAVVNGCLLAASGGR